MSDGFDPDPWEADESRRMKCLTVGICCLIGAALVLIAWLFNLGTELT